MFNHHSQPKQSVGTMTQNTPKGTLFIQFMMAALAVAIVQNLFFQHLLPLTGLSVEGDPIAAIDQSS